MNPEKMTVEEMKFVINLINGFFDEGTSFDPYDISAYLTVFREKKRQEAAQIDTENFDTSG